MVLFEQLMQGESIEIEMDDEMICSQLGKKAHIYFKDYQLEPKDKSKDAIIIEFKVLNLRKEKDLGECVANALKQIEDNNYAAELIEKGFQEERIRKYGFAFEGQRVLIG